MIVSFSIAETKVQSPTFKKKEFLKDLRHQFENYLYDLDDESLPQVKAPPIK